MDTGRYANALNALYTDVMTVRKLVTLTNEDGTSNNEISDAVWLTSSCRASYRRLDVPYEANENGEPIQLEVKIICPPLLDVSAGDYITIERKDGENLLSVIDGYAGLPAKYGTHQEITLIHKGRV